MSMRWSMNPTYCNVSAVVLQAVLERVGTVTEPRSFGVPDWRRRL